MNRIYHDIIQFIRDLYKEPEAFIPLHAPVFTGNEKKYVNECIDTTFVSSVGKFVDRFEEMAAEYVGTKFAVATVNGTTALQIALLLAGVQPGDEVITQPLTFVATANAIAHANAKPVFIDVEKETLGMSPDALKSYLNDSIYFVNNVCHSKISHKPIRACVPMHTFGFPCRIDRIKEICDEYNIALIEDAAESLGSFYMNRHTGNYGLCGILSFNGNKTITTGGGGMIITNNEELAKKAKHLTTTAKLPHQWEYIHDYIAYNFRLPNINAALGCAQMENLSVFIEKKRQLAFHYENFFKAKKIPFIRESKNSKANYWLNTILMDNRKDRDNFLKYTNENGIMTRPAWQLLNKLDMFNKCHCSVLSNANWLADRLVNIPSSVIL